MSAKFTLTLADDTTKTYSRKIDAVRAGDKSGQAYRVDNPKGEMVTGSLGPADAPAPAPAPTKGSLPTFEKLVGGIMGPAKSKPTKAKVDSKAIAKEVDAAKSTRKGGDRTWTVSGPDATHKCAGACGEVKGLKAFPTTKKNGQRGVECRTCRDARTKK
ncbi:hypothetical protein [Nocardioides nanhaiensis]|uniref:Uncharacterized protein n=1 Tax=Nocardioides nanhaiensis TaxID=1476871 RepID=A0ABP8W4J2_9ACTN